MHIYIVLDIMPEQRCLKIVTVGNRQVGKTTLMKSALVLSKRIAKEQIDYQHKISLPNSYWQYHHNISTVTYTIQAWDITYGSQYNPYSKLYFRNTNIICLCIEINDKQSVKIIGEWLSRLKHQYGFQLHHVIIVGCKCDLVEEGKGDREVRDYCAEVGVEYWKVSAVSGEGIREMWDKAEEIASKNWESDNNKKQNMKLQTNNKTKKSKCY